MKRLLVMLVLLCVAACAPAAQTAQVATEVIPSATASEPLATNTPRPTATARPAAVAEGSSATPADICAAALPAPTPPDRTYSEAGQALQPGVDYRAILCTAVGPVYVDLLEDYTPITVNSFVFLANEGYYNNTTFHRVIEGFMAQAGDPQGTGEGGPGYTFQEEFVGFLHFDRPGLLAMARTNQPGTNGSQFFVTTAPYPTLDYQYTIFGEVLEGQENVANIRLRDPASDPEPGTALDTVVIITDPSTVTTTYTAPALAVEQDILSAIATVDDEFPAEMALELIISRPMSAEEVVATAPEAVQESYSTFLTSHNHQFTIASALLNVTCNLDTAPFMSANYSINVFATPEDAEAALNDAFLPTLPPAQGATEVTEPATLRGPLYTGRMTACNRDAVRAITHWRNGRYLVTVDVTMPANHNGTLDQWVLEFGFRYDRALSSVYRRDLRG